MSLRITRQFEINCPFNSHHLNNNTPLISTFYWFEDNTLFLWCLEFTKDVRFWKVSIQIFLQFFGLLMFVRHVARRFQVASNMTPGLKALIRSISSLLCPYYPPCRSFRLIKIQIGYYRISWLGFCLILSYYWNHCLVYIYKKHISKNIS